MGPKPTTRTRVGSRVQAGVEAGGAGLGDPEAPAHFELIGGVVVELLGGFGDGVFGEWRRRRRRLAALVVDVNALVDGRLGPVDRIGAGGGDAGELGVGAAFTRDSNELTEHAGECVGEGLETEVREPEAEVELIGHEVNCKVPDIGGVRKSLR